MENKTYLPVCYSNHQLSLPPLNWRCSVSVDMFAFNDVEPFKVFWHTEPEELVPLEQKLIKNSTFYDLILTYNQEVLSQCANAKLFPPGSVWTMEADTSRKKFQVSYLTSSKVMCQGHQFRQDVFKCLPTSIKEVAQQHGPWQSTEEDLVLQEARIKFPYVDRLPLVKHKSPPYLPTKRELLVPFQYSITMENCQRNNCFTEKINDCFATKTIPIYFGAPNIREFYNANGLFTWNTPQELFDILNSLTPDLYASKHAAIEDNYNRTMKYADRTGNLVRAIQEAWQPVIKKVHSGEANVPPEN